MPSGQEMEWVYSTPQDPQGGGGNRDTSNRNTCLRHVWLSEVFDEIVIVLGRLVLKEAVVDGVTLDRGG